MRERGARGYKIVGLSIRVQRRGTWKSKRKGVEIGPSGSGRCARDVAGTGCSAQRGEGAEGTERDGRFIQRWQKSLPITSHWPKQVEWPDQTQWDAKYDPPASV